MAVPEGLELERLIAPISEDAPAGNSLRREDGSIDPDFDAVKSAAQEARMRERELLRWESTPSRDDDREPLNKPEPPNWRRVEQLAVRVLEQRCKDLWVAAWLIEAAVRTRGYVGFRDGCRIVHAWVTNFWEHLHPLPLEDDDEDPIEFKVSQLAGLNGSEADGVLIVPLRNVPLIDSDEFGPLTLWHFTMASKNASAGDASSRREDGSGLVSLEEFERAMLRTPVSELQSRSTIVGEALEELAKMDAALEERCRAEDGHNYAPPTSKLRSVLEEARSCLEMYVRRVSPAAGEESAAEQASVAADASPSGGGGDASAGGGRLRTREDAFRMLQQVADFFRRTEPHSPVSYALEQAVRWGRLPLPELLRDLISDDSVRSEVYRRTGIPPPPDES